MTARRSAAAITIAALSLFCAASATNAATPARARAGDGFKPDATMLQFPDVSATSIVFVYGNDLWTVSRSGGVAQLLASPPGKEYFPKFSADGSMIAFTGNYDGNSDIYVIPAEGGISTRVTHHPAREFVTDWTADGRIIFYSSGHNGLTRQESVFTVLPEGGLPEKLPMPYGTTATISRDGAWVAYTPWTRDFRTWKRYRGGWATDIWLFNLKNHSSRRITDWEGTDTIPMWHGATVYYLSDNGPEHRQNIWSFDTRNGERKQITTFKDFDIKWPSIGPGDKGQGEIVFQYGSRIMLLDLRTGASRPVDITIPGDRPALRPQTIDASKFIAQRDLSPSGKRIVVEARGDIWTLPAETGVTRNLTRTSGVAERDPLWSPNGKWIAYLSDETGEYELYLIAADAGPAAQTPRKLTSDGSAYRFLRAWSPDSKRIIFTDKSGAIYLHTLGGDDHDGSAPGTTVKIAQDRAARQVPIRWSHDSRWIALILEEPNYNSAVYLYDVESGALTRRTDAMFSFNDVAFDRKGDFLYAVSDRNFAATYSSLDTTWVYRDSEVILALPLRADVKSPLLPRSDSETVADTKAKDKDDKKKDDASDEPAVAGKWTGSYAITQPQDIGSRPFTLHLAQAEDGAISGTISSEGHSAEITDATFDKTSGALSFKIHIDAQYTITVTVKDGKLEGTWSSDAGLSGTITATLEAGDGKSDTKGDKPVTVEFDNLSARAIRTTIKPGGFRGIAVNDKNELVYLRDNPDGPGGTLQIYNFLAESEDDRVEKKILDGVRGFVMSSDGKSIGVMTSAGMGVIKAAAGQSVKTPVPTDAMLVTVNPREEWRQMFTDCWRIFRDWFYDPGMHGVDWKGVHDHYAALINDCVVRDDLTFLIQEMISELNVGHAYYRPGDADTGPQRDVGLLGCDFALVKDGDAAAYRITRIYQGAPWDDDARGPLSQPGVDVKEGDYLLAVNGVPIDTSKDPWAAFINTAGKPTALTISSTPHFDDSAREIIVKPLRSDADLRYRAWIEANRAYVEYKSDGKVSYIYVPNTQVVGQSDLVRQFYGQRDKAALIIDDRWNGGGQIPTRFIELLNRPVTNYWARRDGRDWKWPPDSHQGPKCMLINGLSASGGDMFPALFRQAGLGKLIGTRTWGGLVGISGNAQLIDGTAPAVPTFGYYQVDGTWGIEGHGVDPDIEVVEDPALMTPASAVHGVADPQLDAAIDLMLKEIDRAGYQPPARPAGPNRAGMGIAPEDK